MFHLHGTLKYYLYPLPVDMRKNFYTLSGVVNSLMNQNVRDGGVFIFMNRHQNVMKILHMEYHRLSRYHLDGRYKIDNNLFENTIRPLALGRKNYMFCGNHDAAENAAIMYSMLGCCAALDVNPREWLTDVLTRIPNYNNNYSLDLADMLPHNWKVGRELQSSPMDIQ